MTINPKSPAVKQHKFFEFFAGGGMARAGLGTDWKCLFANDFDGKKALSYQTNWGVEGELHVGDVRQVCLKDVDDIADLVWASFPCQDLSLAGAGAGLEGENSGTFYPFWDVIEELIDSRKQPKIIALENVCGALTSRQGRDFQAICNTFNKFGYRFGALVIDASLFVPQSRPRLFMIGVSGWSPEMDLLTAPEPVENFHTSSLKRAYGNLSAQSKKNWVWWNLPSPPMRTSTLSDIVEHRPKDVSWNTTEQTQQLLSIMTSINLAKVDAAKRSGRSMVGTIYKRTRLEKCTRVVRAEVRFDNIAGCLRTPNGGSSRQTIIIIEGNKIKSRLLSSRETARLMGLSENYKLPNNYNQAYHLTGDGVAVPVVRYLAEHLFEPLLTGNLSISSMSHVKNSTKKLKNVG